VLVYSMPVWLLIMSWIILGERVRGAQWAAVIAALLGLVIVISPWKTEGTGIGNFLGIAAGVCSAASAIAAKLLFRKDRNVDLLTFNAWQMLFGSLPLLAIAFATSNPAEMISTEPWYLISLLYNVVGVCALSILLWFYTLRRLSAGTAGLGRLLAPVVGVTASWLQLGERPDGYEIVGILLIFGGLCALAGQQLFSERRGATRKTEVAVQEATVAPMALEPSEVVAD
jgi:drug/metabolite transporter (DMT)-like permease